MKQHVTTTLFIPDPADQHHSSPSRPPSLSCLMPPCFYLFSLPRTPPPTSHHIKLLFTLQNPFPVYSLGSFQATLPYRNCSVSVLVHLRIIAHVTLCYNYSHIYTSRPRAFLHTQGCHWPWLSYLCIPSVQLESLEENKSFISMSAINLTKPQSYVQRFHGL